MLLQRHWHHIFRLLFFIFAGLAAGRAQGQENEEVRKAENLLSTYKQFLMQADDALKSPDRAWAARQALEYCPKEQRHFEWYFLNGKAKPGPRFFKGVGERVRALAFSPDGKTLASGRVDAVIQLWDFGSGKVYRSLEGQEGGVYSLAFHPDGKTLASGSSDQTIRLWDIATGKNLNTYPSHNGSVYGLTFSQDGAWLISFGTDDEIHVFDVKGARTRAVWSGKKITCLAISGDGKHLACGSKDRDIRILSVPDLQLVTLLRGHAEAVTGLAFHPDGKRLISTGIDGIRIWDLKKGRLLQSLTDADAAPTYAMAINLKGTALATFGSDNRVKVWFEPFARPSVGFGVPDWGPTDAVFSPRGQLVTPGFKDTLRVDDITEEVEILNAPGPIWSVSAVSDHVLVSMTRGTAALDLEQKQVPSALQGHSGQVRAIVMQPQGKLLATAGSDRIVKIWDPSGTTLIHHLTGHKGLIRALAFDAGGKHLASASEDKTIKIWDVATGKAVRTLRGHKGMVTSVVYLPQGNMLASAGGDGTIKIWNLATGQAVQSWPAHEDIASHLAVSPDGTRLASAGTDHRIKIWDAGTGKALHTLHVQTSMVQALAFSPDGSRLVSGNIDGVTLWDPKLGEAVYTFSRPTGPINAVAFSPDGTRLYSGSYDGRIMQWRAPAGD